MDCILLLTWYYLLSQQSPSISSPTACEIFGGIVIVHYKHFPATSKIFELVIRFWNRFFLCNLYKNFKKRCHSCSYFSVAQCITFRVISNQNDLLLLTIINELTESAHD